MPCPTPDIGVIAAPTTIIWGELDDLLPSDDGEELHRAVPGSRLVRYAGTGHLVLWEQPRRVADDVTGLWERLVPIG